MAAKGPWQGALSCCPKDAASVPRGPCCSCPTTWSCCKLGVCSDSSHYLPPTSVRMLLQGSHGCLCESQCSAWQPLNAVCPQLQKDEADSPLPCLASLGLLLGPTLGIAFECCSARTGPFLVQDRYVCVVTAKKLRGLLQGAIKRAGCVRSGEEATQQPELPCRGSRIHSWWPLEAAQDAWLDSREED